MVSAVEAVHSWLYARQFALDQPTTRDEIGSLLLNYVLSQKNTVGRKSSFFHYLHSKWFFLPWSNG
jgi:hypothetical protein